MLYLIFQERSGNNTFSHNALSLQYKLDNEFELVFVVAYQRILQLSYVDKFLNDIHLEFRDKYKNELQGGRHIMDFDFKMTFDKVLRDCEKWGKIFTKSLHNHFPSSLWFAIRNILFFVWFFIYLPL